MHDCYSLLLWWADARLVTVALEGAILAKTNGAVKVCETAGPPVFYIPPEDINFELLKLSPILSSLCEWKGDALSRNT